MTPTVNIRTADGKLLALFSGSIRGLRSDLLVNGYVLNLQQTKCSDVSDTGYRGEKGYIVIAQ